MLLGTQRVNGQGSLEIGGCDAVALARRFGTPLYVLDEACLRGNCRRYRAAFESRYPNVLICFAAKALMTSALCRIMDQEGLGLDVVSAGELYTALRARFPVNRIFLHGSDKSPQEVELALRHRVHRVVVDNLEEIAQFQQAAAAQDAVVDMLIRVTPGVEVNSHTHVQTGKVDTKFGLSIASGAALEGVSKALQAPNARVRGIHCHIGSQIVDLQPFREAARMMVEFAADVRDRLGLLLEEVNMGGGLGVRYLPTDRPPSVEDFAQAVAGTVAAVSRARDLPLPRLILEPGRGLVGEAGTTLYTIGVVKEIPGVRTYVSVDGGLADNPRPALYDAKYSAIVANKAARPLTTKVTVSGKSCESDTLIVDLETPEVAAGDLLAVQTTGAYNYSMSSNYNRLPRPAMVLVTDGQADLIVERESLEDLVRMDRVPDRLAG
jgi:diaminopimelate decarboxylase